MSRSVQPTNYRRPAPAPVVEAPAVPCPVCQAPAGEPCAFTSAILPVINPGTSHHGRVPPVFWETLEPPTSLGPCLYRRLDGTAIALAKALVRMPPDTTLEVGGLPDGASPAEGIWFYPEQGKASIL